MILQKNIYILNIFYRMYIFKVPLKNVNNRALLVENKKVTWSNHRLRG